MNREWKSKQTVQIGNFGKSRGAFAIFLAMILMVLIILIGIYLMERIVPASKSVKGVEQGNMAYYTAASAIERAMLAFSGATPWTETGGVVGGLSGSGYSFYTIGSGTMVPYPGLGNSEFDPEHAWNIFGIGRPIQLKLPPGINPGELKWRFRAPDLNGDNSWGEQVSGAGSGTVNWVLTASGESLVSESGALITANEINTSSAMPVTLQSRLWRLVSIDTPVIVTDFTASTGSGNCVANSCVLKLSITTALVGMDGTALPYLEYQLSSPSGTPIPQQWTRLSAEGYFRGFKRPIFKDLEQSTTNEALDFAVFQ